MTDKTDEAVAWRVRGKNLTWEYRTVDAPLISVVATDPQPLFPASSLASRDARIAELEALLEEAGDRLQTLIARYGYHDDNTTPKDWQEWIDARATLSAITKDQDQ